MKRMLIALASAIAAALIATVTIGSTTALLGGKFEVTGNTAVTEDFGVAVIEAPTVDQTLETGVSTVPLTWRIRNNGSLPADIGSRFTAPADAQGYAVARSEVEVTVTVTAEIYLSPAVAMYTGPLGEVADRMLVAERSIPAGETWRIDVAYRLPDDKNPALADGISLPWAMELTARQTADGMSDLRTNTGTTTPTLGWLH